MDEPTRERVEALAGRLKHGHGSLIAVTPIEVCESWLRLEAVLLLIASCGKVEVNAFGDGLELNLVDVKSIALSEKHAETVAAVLRGSHG
jgi:hypothetical protein